MRLVLFDIDGTLTLTNETDDRCFLVAITEALGGTRIDPDWDRYPHVTASGIAWTAFETHRRAPPSAEDLRSLRERFVTLLRQEFARDPDLCRLVPGAAAAIDGLAERRGYAVGLATGGWREAAELKLRHAGLWRPGLPFASASDARARDEIMLLAAGQAATGGGVPGFESAVYVGDGPWDLRAARRLGWGFIGVGAGEAGDRLRRAGAQRVIADFSDVGVFLDAVAAALPPAAPSPT
jgi:phosphoglycolate phosphatase-like HAD superfamily hydrolase